MGTQKQIKTELPKKELKKILSGLNSDLKSQGVSGYKLVLMPKGGQTLDQTCEWVIKDGFLVQKCK